MHFFALTSDTWLQHFIVRINWTNFSSFKQ